MSVSSCFGRLGIGRRLLGSRRSNGRKPGYRNSDLIELRCEVGESHRDSHQYLLARELTSNVRSYLDQGKRVLQDSDACCSGALGSRPRRLPRAAMSGLVANMWPALRRGCRWCGDGPFGRTNPTWSRSEPSFGPGWRRSRPPAQVRFRLTRRSLFCAAMDPVAVRRAVFTRDDLPAEVVAEPRCLPDANVRAFGMSLPATSEQELVLASQDHAWQVRVEVATQPSTPVEVFVWRRCRLLDASRDVRLSAPRCLSCPLQDRF